MTDPQLIDKLKTLNDLSGFNSYSLAAFAFTSGAIDRDEFRIFLTQLGGNWKHLK